MNQFSIPTIRKQNLENFKDTLRQYNYSQDQFRQFGINPFAYSQYDLPVFAYRLKALTPFNILSHIFFLGKRLKEEYFSRIFNESEIGELLRIKIIERVDSAYIKSNVMLLPYKNYYFACDFVFQSAERLKKRQNNYESVYPVNLDSITLSEASFKNKVNKVLDLCCGCGILGIVASTQSKEVIGIDINPRAVNFSKFNLLLNNINNCEFKCGNLFEPIGKEKFDLILSNPPYEISMFRTNLFQDGGKDGFKILKKIIEGLPAHLTDNGFCQIITKFAEFQNESKQQILKKWVNNKNIYTFFLKLYSMNVEKTVISICTDRLGSTGNINFNEYARNVGKIMTYFDKIRLTRISFGLFTIKIAPHFKYVEQIFDSSEALSTELSGRLQYIIYRHFAFSLGFFGILYFLKIIIYRFTRKVFLRRGNLAVDFSPLPYSIRVYDNGSG